MMVNFPRIGLELNPIPNLVFKGFRRKGGNWKGFHLGGQGING